MFCLSLWFLERSLLSHGIFIGLITSNFFLFFEDGFELILFSSIIGEIIFLRFFSLKTFEMAWSWPTTLTRCWCYVLVFMSKMINSSKGVKEVMLGLVEWNWEGEKWKWKWNLSFGCLMWLKWLPLPWKVLEVTSITQPETQTTSLTSNSTFIKISSIVLSKT